jgi:hypothetical protein
MKIAVANLCTIICVLAALAYCQEQNNQPVVIHVYRDRKGPASHWLFRQIGEFQKAETRTASGKPIVVATAEPRDYRKTLADVGKDLKPDLVILNSKLDAEANLHLRAEVKSATSLCSGQFSCPAFVPPWTSGETKEAAQKLLSFLVEHRRRD